MVDTKSCHHSSCRATSFQHGETAVPFGTAAVRGRVIRRKLEAHWRFALDFLVYSQKHSFYCTYVAIPEAPA